MTPPSKAIDYTYEEHAARAPMDEDLLPDLGRVMWAAVRLHHRIRDELHALDGERSDAPNYLEGTLGQAVSALEQRGPGLPEERREQLAEWVTVARAAVRQRNRVAHSSVYFAADEREAIGCNEGSGERFHKRALRAVTGHLTYAETTLPRLSD